MTHERPSEVLDSFWLLAHRKKGSYPEHSERSGKWLLFVPVEKINSVWALIKEATEDGKLGGSSKVATMRPNPNSKNPRVKVICVYTYDWADEPDVHRVREALRDLGFTNKLSYKGDDDTYAGKYAQRGDRNISRYYE
jgi:hypothetical protein